MEPNQKATMEVTSKVQTSVVASVQETEAEKFGMKSMWRTMLAVQAWENSDGGMLQMN